MGKSKFSKFANTIVLILLLGYAAGKLGLISPSVTTGFEYTIPTSELQVQTQKELERKLNGYAINQVSLKSELEKIGLTLSEYQTSVTMEIIINISQNGLQGLVLDFQSSLPRDKLKPIYSYIASDITNHVKNHKG